ncbi:MAG: LPS export ABC transporter permease LptG [Candidatus Thiodiazotropha sp. (ex Monitilora ramsayi)]|nr:LPS export ABC transporter permease LptG [Candidatus Thiodiazotropha sp. (ex Monitilora ramsayi)]
MSLLDRYIGRAVLLSITGVLLLLLVLIGFFEVVSELEDVDGNYTTGMAYTYVALTLPRYTYEIFPLATLLGSLIGLGALAGNAELMAMRAAGVSIGRIVLATLKSGLVVLLVILLIGENLAPQAELQAQRMKMAALSNQIMLKTRYGFWSRDENTFINIRQILPDQKLANISIYHYDDQQRLQRALHARGAVYGESGWILESIRESRFKDSRIEVETRERQHWQTQLEPSVLDVVSVKPHMLAAWDLWRYVEYLKLNGQASQRYEVAFWGKVFSPAVTLVMLFLSIPFVFGSLRSVGIGQRIFVGAMIGIVFYLLNRAFSYLAVVYALNAIVTTILPILLFFGYALWKFRRVGQ